MFSVISRNGKKQKPKIGNSILNTDEILLYMYIDLGHSVFDINQPGLPTVLFLSFFNYVLISISAFMALSTVFHSINSPDNSECMLKIIVPQKYCG